MKLYLLTAFICLTIIGIESNPIIVTAHDDADEESPSEVIETGKVQEETRGVFKQSSQIPATSKSKETKFSQKQLQKEVEVPERKAIVTPTNTEKPKQTGRQSGGDDDDDDDDDFDLGVDDDDDDDEDDDDDDYGFDGLFDDLLGEDDDDDDDDDAPVAPAEAQPQPQPQPAPVPIAETEDISPDDELNEAEAAEATGELGTDGTTDETIVVKDPSNVGSSVTNTVYEQTIVDPEPVYDDDDDDDEDDDDIVDLTVDDDDDDEDDDDDDDESDLGDVIDARKSRSLKTRMPAVYIAKYNRFLDNILGRINKILAVSYDPVRVKLQSGDSKKNKNNSKAKKKTKKPSKSQYKTPDSRNKMAEFPISRAIESEAREPSFILISKAADNETVKRKKGGSQIRGTPTKSKANSGKNKNKGKGNSKASKKSPKARATLYGLSTIRRDGDVSVNMMANYTTVKTNFILGPLTLRVEKEFGRGTKRELKSAIATTTDMYGRLNLRIMHGGAATLHTIRVLQPKQVRVESKDNHDKTKEYVWKRSSHIAHVVSSKLAKAAKSMLRPPPSL